MYSTWTVTGVYKYTDIRISIVSICHIQSMEVDSTHCNKSNLPREVFQNS